MRSISGRRERQHHSWSEEEHGRQAHHVGFKGRMRGGLDKRRHVFKGKGSARIRRPYQARLAAVIRRVRGALFRVEKRERCCSTTCHRASGQRLDHFNVSRGCAGRDRSTPASASATEYARRTGAGGRIAASWLHQR